MDTDDKKDEPKSKVVGYINTNENGDDFRPGWGGGPEGLLDWLKSLPPGCKLSISFPDDEDKGSDSKDE